MSEQSGPAAFRRQATRIHNAMIGATAILFLVCSGLGWWIGAGGGTVGATLVWAMSQDGA